MNKILLSVMFIAFTSLTLWAQKSNQKIIGTWTGTVPQKEANPTLTQSVNWIFSAGGKGTLKTVMSTANSNGITCTINQSFTWTIKTNGQAVIKAGRAVSTCKSTGGQSADALQTFATNYENEMSNETWTYDLDFEGKSILTMGGVRMKRK